MRADGDSLFQDVFRHFNVSHTQGHEFPRAVSSSCRLNNDIIREETRGRPRIISANKIREMERILQEEGIEARAMTWQQLGFEVGLECTGETVKMTLGSIDYRKCIACKKGWVNEKTARDRKAWERS